MDNDYEKFFQLWSIIETDLTNKESILDEFLQQNQHIINYQIPANDYFKLENADLIGCTPLHLAFKVNELKTFKKLLKFGADFTIKNALGETVLHQTVTEYLKYPEVWKEKKLSQHCFTDSILSAHLSSNSSVNSTNNDGISHFHISCLVNNTEANELFLKSGVSIDQAVNFDSPTLPGYTPLHFAARFSSVETMKILLQHGANVHSRDAKGMSSLHLLINHNMELLHLPYSIYTNDCKTFEVQDSKCLKIIDSDLINITRKKFELNKQMILLLTDLNSNYNCKVIDDIGLSKLHVACCLGDTSTIKPFFEKNVNLEHSINRNSSIWPGYTALHFAAQVDIKTVKSLLEKGANILAKDAKGITPLDLYLQRYDFQEICFIIGSQSNLKNICFSDGTIKLFDFFTSMQETSSFQSFLENIDINISIPDDSIIWPGYTLLHLTVAVCKTIEVLNICGNSKSYSQSEMSSQIVFYFQRVIFCLDLGANITIKNTRGWTPLHLAFYENKFYIASLLLEYHPTNINPVDDNGFSHLHIACFFKKSVEKFVDASDIDSSVKSSFIAGSVSVSYSYNIDDHRGCYISAGSTPLHIIARSVECIDFNIQNLISKLIECGANIHLKDEFGFTPIHRIFTRRIDVKDNCDTSVFSLMDLENRVANCGLSYLHISCCKGNVAATERMSDLGADVNEMIRCEKTLKDFEDVRGNPVQFMRRYAGYTPLEFAMDESRVETMSVLLRRDADVLMKKPDGSVLLQKILIKSNLDRKLVFFQEYKNNVKMQKYIEGKTGLTLLHMACAALEFRTIEQLLNEANGVDINAVAHANSPVWPSCTALHVLAMEGKSITSNEGRKSICKIMEMMMDKGGNVLLQNEEKKTPLHVLVDRLISYDNNSPLEIDLMSIMLIGHKEYGVNPIDARGISHFDIACMCNDVTIVKAFLDHGVDINHTVDYFVEEFGGCTPLHFAAARKSRETVILLLEHNANVNAKNLMGESPIQTIAFRTGYTNEDLSLLINAGANINEKNLFGETPLESLIRLYVNDDDIFMDDTEILKTAVNLRCRVNVFYPHQATGFMGSNIQNYGSVMNRTPTTDGSVIINPIIQAVIQAPEINDADPLLGRNVIHNIISVDRSFELLTVEKEYVIAIGQLINAGFHVDQQDNRSFTPLHIAVSFGNLDGIKGLLKNGADFNCVDANGIPAYAYHSQLDCSIDDDDTTDLYIHIEFQRHFNKLQFFKLNVHEANQDLITQRPNYIDVDYHATERHRQFIKEVDSVKNERIDPYSLTLNHFLSETGAVLAYAFKSAYEKEVIDKFFRAKHVYLYENFPELMDILYLQYRKAVARIDLIEPALYSLNILSGYDLPCLCSEAILRFLTNDELTTLIASMDDV